MQRPLQLFFFLSFEDWDRIEENKRVCSRVAQQHPRIRDVKELRADPPLVAKYNGCFNCRAEVDWKPKPSAISLVVPSWCKAWRHNKSSTDENIISNAAADVERAVGVRKIGNKGPNMMAVRLPPVLDLIHEADMVFIDIEKTRSDHEMGRSVVFLFSVKRGHFRSLKLCYR